MSMAKGILWDNDGVLVESENLFYQANRDFLAGFDIELSTQDFFDWFLLTDRGAWHQLGDLDAAQIRALRTARDQLYLAYLRDNTELATEGIRPLLAELAERVPMGVVTSSRAVHFGQIHSRLDLMQHFEFVVHGDMVERGKPAPDLYLKGLERIGLAARDCLAIEDSPRGLAAARAAGIPCIVLRNALVGDFGFDGAYRVVDSVAQLGHVIHELI